MAGKKLKTLRHRRKITVREVEQASKRIADYKGDKRFCISNGWLAQLENGASEPSICKLFSLSVIYRVSFLDLVRLYDVDVEDRETYESVADPTLTRLIPQNNDSQVVWEDATFSGLTATSLEASNTSRYCAANECVSHIVFGRLGASDFTMYPMIRPGALLRIDTSKVKVVSGCWHSEHERPIYFVELRDAYACGWCELQGNELLIIPHYTSPVVVRRFLYPREAEIVGRVIGYTTSCLDHAPAPNDNVSKRVHD